ncbi:sulfurtransferase [Aquamicrobium sp. LC103]|uniref:sulfurtransferase n=1 Tax=Aquamicrobium sp. LC103 TaxID=1120658 RepID=UPI0010C975A7|nr:sulfurtransferase [Aquamicrobium sp. LC103]TKT74395.1 sulfurtransferase [Aquamicrobium sp. LC103]
MRFAPIAIALTLAFATPAFAQSADIRPLVDAEWLKAHAGEENVVILDIRDNIEGTDLGSEPYIENSVVAPYASAGWRTEVDGVPGMLPPLEEITALIGNLGIDNDDHVVIVPWGTDSSEFGGATRVYWTFKYLGHDAVSILDGGWRQYDAAGGARSAELAKPQPAEFTYELQDELLATTADVEAALKSGVKLIDGRPAEQFEGKSKSPVVRTEGTIPGAVNIVHSDLYSSDHALFARPETVEALSKGVGLAANEENITFCNTGHWASIAWFGLSEVLGNKKTSMYDGSMAEWTADSSRPVE